MNKSYIILSFAMAFRIIAAMSVCYFLCQCSSNNTYTARNIGTTASDSIKLQCVDTITLNIGDKILPIPCSSQILEYDTIKKYAILDENQLHVFDISNNSLIANINMRECGTLNNYSGFSFINNDTIFAYNYKDKICFLLNAEGNVLCSQTLHKDLIEKVSPETLSCTPPIFMRNRVILSGTPISHSLACKKDPISLYWDYGNHKLVTGAAYPDEYSKGFFGGIYYNTIYQCKDSNEYVAYSFPASNYIYRYNKDLELVDSLYMGSRYTQSIESSKDDMLEFMRNKEARLNYYLEQDSYEQIFFNYKENLYYRIAEHPLSISNSEIKRKPFSIIVMDDNGHLITETPIINKDMSLITPNAHVYNDGIIIQLESEDENIINFAYFKIIK